MSIRSTVSLLIPAVVASSVVTYKLSRRAFGRGMTELQESTNRELNSLANLVKGLETQVTELRKIALAPSGMATASVSAQPAQATSPMVGKVTTGEKPEKREAEEITPDTLVVLSAAVTAFLGKRVRIRSAKMLQSPYEIVNPWSQQGRVVVQASHNLRSRN